ncbi:MAG: hypothetical protein ACFE0O_15975 [Opitutales bacterium]
MRTPGFDEGADPAPEKQAGVALEFASGKSYPPLMSSALFTDLHQAINALPVVDTHTHLGSHPRGQGRLVSGDLRELAGYHWLRNDLERAAGKAFARTEDSASFMAEAAPWFRYITHTPNHRAFQAVLEDLFGFEEPYLTPDNWEPVDDAIRQAADEPKRAEAILRRAGIRRMVIPAEVRTGLPASGDPLFSAYTMVEYAIMARAARGLAKLTADPALGWPAVDRALDALPADPAFYADRIREHIRYAAEVSGVCALHLWVPAAWHYRPGRNLQDLEAVIAKVAAHTDRSQPSGLSFEERSALFSACLDKVAEEAGHHGLVIQLFHGMMEHSGQLTVPVTVRGDPDQLFSWGHLFATHPETRFDLLPALRAHSQEITFMARQHPNLSLSGAWWNGFTPATLETHFRDRLEILPTNAWNAFYSDAYRAEWAYGKLTVSRRVLAATLSRLVDVGWLTATMALDHARQVLLTNPDTRFAGGQAPPAA